MLVPITGKDRVKELEEITVSLMNFPLVQRKYFDEYMNVLGWYHIHDDIDANTSINIIWKKLEEQLGCPPVSFPTYEYRNALWAFSWKNKNNIVLLYFSKKGMNLQVNEKFMKKEIKPLLDYLGGILTIKF